MKMQGYNGSQCWDTSFAIQAIVEGGFVTTTTTNKTNKKTNDNNNISLEHEFPECVTKIYSYLDRTQIKKDENNNDYFFRHISKGSVVVVCCGSFLDFLLSLLLFS